MGKPNFRKVFISRITSAAPDLKFIAYYHAEDASTNACMSSYSDRSFVYILTIAYNGSEHFLYAGKSGKQYTRFISHLNNYAFDYIYLFECEPEQLSEAEAAVIRELRPLLNIDHNPDAKHNKQFLGVQIGRRQDLQTIHHYLQVREHYTPVGLYGFALPPAVFSVLEKKAAEQGCNCSQVLLQLLERNFTQEIVDELHSLNCETAHTNLITAKAYGMLHGRSREQIKQYLNQGNRVLGTAKIGRDWVLLNDATFPADLRRKIPK